MTHDYEKLNQALRLLNGRLKLTGAPRFAPNLGNYWQSADSWIYQPL